MTISEPERLILDALSVSPDLPKIRHRAEIILKAVSGLDDKQIAESLLMQWKDVLHWRRRFEAHGIRGLWDERGPRPEKHMTPEKEQAVLWDLLYDRSGMAGLFNLNNKLIGQYHRLSRHAVNRICAKHGIVRDKFGRVNIDRLKIFQDPLFGVTVSGIAGMISSTFSALALRSNARPFSELIFGADSLVEQTIDPFLAQLRPLAQAREPWSVVAYERKEIEQEFLLYWLNAMEARRNPDSEVHLFMSEPTRLPLNSTAFKDWLAAHPQFRAYYAPKIVHMSWFKFIFRCFTLIAKLPVQAGLIRDTKRMTDGVTGYAEEHPREPFYSVL